MSKNIMRALVLAAIMALLSPTAACAQKKQKKIQGKAESAAVQAVKDSLNAILDKAKGGDAEAQNEVGGWYYRGRHVKQDYKEALQWWAKAAKQGNVLAIGNMGLCYQTGHGIAADSAKAAKLYQQSIKKGNKTLLKQQDELAKKGDVFSNMLMAACYQKGIGVAKDDSKAVPYLTTAAGKGVVSAQRDLALILLNAKKPAEAAKWFKRGADNHDNTCLFYYGRMLLEGKNVRQDKKQGANLLLEAANNGFVQAMYHLGNCYAAGEGVTKNEEQAVKWYKLAAGKGAANAQWTLAQCLREGKGAAVNYDQALYWYAESAARGYTKSFRRLIADSISGSPFIAYMKGMKSYINKDFDDALKQFKVVAKAKVDDGKVMEAAVIANADYAKRNMKKGVKLLDDAAATNAQAMYLLAALYEAGKGVDKDMNKAVDYMTKAAEMGYGTAQSALADMYFEGRGVEKSYDKAVEWYGKAYEQGQLTESGVKRLASCYENGWGGLQVDKDKAAEVLKTNYHSHITELLKLI